jgi:hypothetical protein
LADCVLGHGPDGAVVLRATDLLAGVDALLNHTQLGVRAVQVLQGDQSARIRIDAIQRHTSSFLFKVSDAILAAGSILLEKVCSNCRAILAQRQSLIKSLKSLRYMSVNDEGPRQFLPGAFRHGQLLPGTICAPSRKRRRTAFDGRPAYRAHPLNSDRIVCGL